MPGYILTLPAQLWGPAGVASGEFTATMEEPTAGIGEGGNQPGGFVLQDFDAEGDAVGGVFTVDGSPYYRVTLTETDPSSVFTYTPPGGFPDGPITLHWVDTSIGRPVPADVVYTVGDTAPGGANDLLISRPGGRVLLVSRPG